MDDISEDKTPEVEIKKLRHAEMCIRFPIHQMQDRRKKCQKPLPEMVLNPEKASSKSGKQPKINEM